MGSNYSQDSYFPKASQLLRFNAINYACNRNSHFTRRNTSMNENRVIAADEDEMR